jgi:hypothetical protein
MHSIDPGLVKDQLDVESCAHYLSKPPSCIYSTSIRQGKFPVHLKYLVVVPLFKNGDKSLISNYRPISLLTGFFKTYEILIYLRLIQHIQLHNIIVSQKFGFRKGFSMENATYLSVERVS